MNFPFPQFFVNFGPFILIVGVVLVGVGTNALRSFLRVKRSHAAGEMITPPDLIVGFLVPVFALAFCCILGSVIFNAFMFQSDPENISELRIERISSEMDLGSGKVIVFTDKAAIAEGWRKLATAQSYWRNHETFQDGYRMQLRYVGASSYSNHYLGVFRRSSAMGSVAVVEPFTSVYGLMSPLGDYRCPEFLAWVSRNIDPLFREGETPSTTLRVVAANSAE